MSATEPAGLQANFTLKPAFVIGVTGNMDPNGYDEPQSRANGEPVAVKAIQEKVRQILDWVRTAEGFLDPVTGVFSAAESPGPDGREEYRSCWKGLGLRNTPIIVLSSLAPGIDTLVAEAVLDYARKHGADITVRAPLPFPWPLYREASSFVSEPALTAARQARLGGIVEKIQGQAGYCQERDLFAVPLDPKSDGDPASDLHDRNRRKIRYRAAGEYIAVFSDMLLALYDEKVDRPDVDDPLSAGAATIVTMKRRGMSDHLLRLDNTFVWADNGPVLAVPIDRRKNDATLPGDVPERPLRFLHPLDCLPHDCREGTCADEDPRWQEAGDRILRSTTEDLERLNSAPNHSKPGAEDAELLNMLGARSRLPEDRQTAIAAADTLKSCNSLDFDSLARLRRRWADHNSHYDGRVKVTAACFITLALLSTLFLMLFEYWVYDSPPVPPVNLVFFGIAIACVVTGLVAWLVIFRAGHLDDRQLDTRALAEAFRVQWYWLMAGTGESVASSYLRRQRGEVTWIRSAISSVSFPYERTQEWFRGLAAGQSLTILRAIRTGWVKTQEHYFSDTGAKFTARKHSLHHLARTLLWAGLGMTVAGLFAHSLHLAHAVGHFAPLLLRCSGSVVAGLFLLWCAEFLVERWRPHATGHRRPPRLHFWQVFFPGLFHSRLCVTRRSQESASDIIAHALAFLAGLAFAGLVVGGLFHPSLHPLHLPEPFRLLAIVKNLALVGGGLVHLWVALRFLSENIHRFEAMAALFRGADSRLGRHLTALGGQLESNNAPAQQDTIRSAQELLVSLGREALAENAEWLIMHRDHRIEPIIAGA